MGEIMKVMGNGKSCNNSDNDRRNSKINVDVKEWNI